MPHVYEFGKQRIDYIKKCEKEEEDEETQKSDRISEKYSESKR
jgi:hypothetical protein